MGTSRSLILMIQLMLCQSTTNAQQGLVRQVSLFCTPSMLHPKAKTAYKASTNPLRSARCPLPRSSTTICASFPRDQRQLSRRPQERLLPFTRLSSTDSSGEDLKTRQTLASGIHVAEIEVKKSRFIGYAIHTETWSNAKNFLESVVKADHPKARHWCYGVSLGVDPVNERCSDDGEPTGTAGQPILQALRTEGLSDAICVVVRYFGGVKLGAGGLIRAYGGSARKVLRDAPKLERIAQTTIRVQVEPAYIGSVYEAVGKVRGLCLDEEYENDGSLTAMLRCETAALPVLKETLSDNTRGSVKFLD
jgi:uncharacterized YigZ family protein